MKIKLKLKLFEGMNVTRQIDKAGCELCGMVHTDMGQFGFEIMK